MKFVTIIYVLLLTTSAQAETTDQTKICILFSTLVGISVAVGLAINKPFENKMKSGFCTGGMTNCGVLSSETFTCNSQYCEIELDDGTCISAQHGDTLPCSALSEDECNDAWNCKYVDQGAINAVLISLASISLVILLVIVRVLVKRLPLPDEVPNEENTLAQPLLDEEN